MSIIWCESIIWWAFIIHCVSLSFFAIRMRKFSSFWQGSLDFLRQRIRMSIKYDKQKINLSVIIIVNFHKFNFECFWLDDGGTSTKALDLRQYITYKVCIKVLLRRFVAQYWVRISFSLSKELIVWFGEVIFKKIKFWRVCKILIPLEYMAPVVLDILI